MLGQGMFWPLLLFLVLLVRKEASGCEFWTWSSSGFWGFVGWGHWVSFAGWWGLQGTMGGVCKVPKPRQPQCSSHTARGGAAATCRRRPLERGPRLGLPSEGLWVKQGVAEERQKDGRRSRKGQQYTSLLPGLPLAGCVTHRGKGEPGAGRGEKSCWSSGKGEERCFPQCFIAHIFFFSPRYLNE